MGPGLRRGDGVGKLLPSLEGRGWGWVGFRISLTLWHKQAYPPPAPPFQGGESVAPECALAS